MTVNTGSIDVPPKGLTAVNSSQRISPRSRVAARKSGQQRVRRVTVWTAVASLAIGGVLSLVLAQNASAASSPTSSTSGTRTSSGTSSSGDQLQSPYVSPFYSGGGGVHGFSGGS